MVNSHAEHNRKFYPYHITGTLIWNNQLSAIGEVISSNQSHVTLKMDSGEEIEYKIEDAVKNGILKVVSIVNCNQNEEGMNQADK